MNPEIFLALFMISMQISLGAILFLEMTNVLRQMTEEEGFFFRYANVALGSWSAFCTLGPFYDPHPYIANLPTLVILALTTYTLRDQLNPVTTILLSHSGESHGRKSD